MRLIQDSHNFFMQFLPLYTSCLFSVSLNGDIEFTEKADGICSPTFVVDDFQDYFYIHQSFLSKFQDLHKKQMVL